VRHLLEHGAKHGVDVQGPGRQEDVSAETVLENRAKCLAAREYVSLHLTWLWLGAILPLTGWFIVRFLRSRHPDLLGLRLLALRHWESTQLADIRRVARFSQAI
jgi:hypothetical protein